MMWRYALTMTLAGFAIFAICFMFRDWDLAWSAAYVGEMFVFLSVPMWVVVFIRWLKGK